MTDPQTIVEGLEMKEDVRVPTAPGSREPSPAVSAASGFDPSRYEDHGDWVVWHDPLPVEWRDRDWCFARKRPDASFDFQFDYGREESREMCLQTIDYIESEEEREAEETANPAKKEPSDAFLNFINVPLVMQLGAALIAANSVLSCGGRGFADGVHRGQVKVALEAFKEWQDAQSD